MQYVTAIERLQMEKEALRCKVADQEQRMAAQVQKLEAQEQHVREQGEAVKGQEQQVVNPPAAFAPSLPHLAQLHSQYGFCHVFHFCLQFHDSYLRYSLCHYRFPQSSSGLNPPAITMAVSVAMRSMP